MKQSHDNILKGDGSLGSFPRLMVSKTGLVFSSETKV